MLLLRKSYICVIYKNPRDIVRALEIFSRYTGIVPKRANVRNLISESIAYNRNVLVYDSKHEFIEVSDIRYTTQRLKEAVVLKVPNLNIKYNLKEAK